MSSNYWEKRYDVDVVFCIDATGSMKPCLDMVKKNAEKLYYDLKAKMKEESRELDHMRVRLIAFRDYLESMKDKIPPMLVTEFFDLPAQEKSFKDSLTAIQPEGGGDEPEDGLEALAFAIKSKWAKPRTSIQRRQIIVLWTDASTHDLGFGRGATNYPRSMAKDFTELTRWWGYAPDEAAKLQAFDSYMDYPSKRLLIYAPEGSWWSKIANNWCNVIHVSTVSGEGLSEHDYDEIVHLLTSTIVEDRDGQ